MSRHEIERRSTVPLVFLSSRPKWLLGLIVAGLLAAALFAPAAAALPSLAVLVAVLGWLSYLSWPVTPPGGRALRAAALLTVAAAGLARALS